jgi:hypothetical protein
MIKRVTKEKDGEEKRRYVHPSGDLIGSTSLLEDLFPEFNADVVLAKMRSRPSWATGKYNGLENWEIKLAWARNGENCANLGSAMHDR